MAFLKKFAVAFVAITLILGGGAGTQSTSMMLQGGGFIGLIIGLIVLYIFSKMAWRAMGCLPSFLIFSGIILFVLYAIGAFNNGVSGVGDSLKSFLGQTKDAARQMSSSQKSALLAEPESRGYQMSETLSVPASQQEDDIFDYDSVPELFDDEPEPSTQPEQPQSVLDHLPAISAPAQVLSGDTLRIKGRMFRLFGIDAPEMNQSCADQQGRSYNCGVKARSWLKGWIGDYALSCKIMKQDAKGNYLGTCALGEYDLGAALVNAGWAVAYKAQSDVYAPYEQQARSNRRGLWRGQFYMPWDWRELQNKKPKIKVIAPKKERKGFFG